METNKFQTEWCLLQNQFDSYEKHSLYIKLFSIAILLIAGILNTIGLFIILLLFILWLQDAIWKTFQSRIETRLLQLETFIAEKNHNDEFQFNTEYQKTRSGTASLMIEYASQSIRPTVAFPHIILILIAVTQYLN